MNRPWRFNELRRNLDGISQKVLTDSLRSMEEDGSVWRRIQDQGRVNITDVKKRPFA